jgi:hypothetical protein
VTFAGKLLYYYYLLTYFFGWNNKGIAVKLDDIKKNFKNLNYMFL